MQKILFFSANRKNKILTVLAPHSITIFWEKKKYVDLKNNYYHSATVIAKSKISGCLAEHF